MSQHQGASGGCRQTEKERGVGSSYRLPYVWLPWEFNCSLITGGRPKTYDFITDHQKESSSKYSILTEWLLIYHSEHYLS